MLLRYLVNKRAGQNSLAPHIFLRLEKTMEIFALALSEKMCDFFVMYPS